MLFTLTLNQFYVPFPHSAAARHPQASHTIRTAQHIPCGYAFLSVSLNEKSCKPVKVFRCENAVDHFLQAIIHEKDEIAEKLNIFKPMDLNEKQEKSFQEATPCICNRRLYTDKVRDHCQLSGVYKGGPHSDCNLIYKQPKSIPVIFHN